MTKFENINRGYNSMFISGELSLGLVIPIEKYTNGPVPTMKDHLKKAQLAEDFGFKALWVRDVPFNVPSFGDAGQTFDPFTYLGFLAGQTTDISLCVGSIALPLHHPLHVAKSAVSVDRLSDGRLVLGVASGDRYDEYPAMGIDYEKRAALFRDAFSYIRSAGESFPLLAENHFGKINGNIDVLPKPVGHKLSLLITGHSRQSLEWIAENGDGWMYYPRNLYMQEHNINQFRELVSKNHNHDKPFMQSLYIDLHPNEDFQPTPIHLGFRTGVKHLVEFLQHLKSLGVNHVGLNLRFNESPMEETLEKLAKTVLPHFHSNKIEALHE